MDNTMPSQTYTVPALCHMDLLTKLVIPYVKSFRSTSMLFQSNKEWNAQLTLADGTARVAWIDMASQMTALPEQEFEPDEIKKQLQGIKERKEFVSVVRSLVCPWTNEAVDLPIKLEHGYHYTARDMSLSEDNKRLIFRTLEPKPDWTLITEYLSEEFSYPSAPCKGFCKTITRLPVTETKFSELMEIAQKREELRDTIQLKLNHPLNMFKFTGTTSQHVVFKYVPIHGAVFAVLASITHDSKIGGVISDSIYFFSIPDGRMLVHIPFHRITTGIGALVQTRPGRMWIMAGSCVKYYARGPEGDKIRLAPPSERIDEAFSRVIQGDAEGAMRFLVHDMKCDVDMKMTTNHRTLVHYAVMFNKTDALETLLKNKASPYTYDGCSVSPLELACFGFKHECVRMIACSQYPISDESWRDIWEMAWKQVCNADNWNICVSSDPSKTKQYLEVMIPKTVEALWTHIPVMPLDSEYSHIMTGLRSRTILSSENTLRFLMRLHPSLPQRFSVEGGFKCILARGMACNEAQEDSMLKTMQMAVREFGVDINSLSGITCENHLVWAVRIGSLKTVKFLINELGANVKSRSAHEESILKLAISRATVAGTVDPEAFKILNFLSEEVEGLPDLPVSWMAQRVRFYEPF